MDRELKRISDNFVSNTEDLMRIYKSDNPALHLIGGTVLTASERRADAKALEKCMRILRIHEGIFSPIRGIMRTVTSVNMSLSDDPVKYYRSLRTTCDLLRVNRGGKPQLQYMTSMILMCKIKTDMDMLNLVNKTAEVHEAMVRMYGSIYENTEDVTCAFAAASGVYNVSEYAEEVIACRKQFGKVGDKISDNLFMTLALQEGDAEEKCSKAWDIFKNLRKVGVDLGWEREAGNVGILTGLDMTAEEIAYYVREADDILARQNFFSEQSDTGKLRHVYASILTTLAGSKSDVSEEALRSKLALVEAEVGIPMQVSHIAPSQIQV